MAKKTKPRPPAKQAEKLSLELLRTQCEQLRREVFDDPLTNPVRRLSFNISQALELGSLPLDSFDQWITGLHDQALEKRAAASKTYLAAPSLAKTVAAALPASASFSAFQRYWSDTRQAIIFTGHPTFMMPEQTRKALAHAIVSRDHMPKGLAPIHTSPLSLREEHDALMGCLENGAAALNALNRHIFTHAQTLYPRQWRKLTPAPIKFASWVGYDMDGRTDIGWQDVIYHRLREKQARLAHYQKRLTRLDHRFDLGKSDPFARLQKRLNAALAHTIHCVEAFAHPLDDAEALSRAANLLTRKGPGKLINLAPLIKTLRSLALDVEDDAALDLLLLASEMEAIGLGAGAIHFRLNAAQIRNAIRARLNLPEDADLFGRSALNAVCDLIEKAQPLQVNFASLAIEQTTAARITIAIAQIIKHIDAGAPVRLLIAECETPVTILSALYFVRSFGIENHVDVCPLLETEDALERAARIFDRLFKQDIYRKIIRKRGVLAVEAGFSDAGRFMGQVPAALAIERVHVRLAELMAQHGLSQVRAIIFDTHGESMGRGGHPTNVTDRMLYTLSPFARCAFQSRTIALTHETSFQGGDGFVFFSNAKIATKTLTALLHAENQAQKHTHEKDLFYRDISTSLDFYYRVKQSQETLFADKSYHMTIGGLGLALLPIAGSRKTKRQFERRADEDTSLRRVRAIPHNGALQQLCFLANITAGIGDAAATEWDEFIDMYHGSDRLRRIMRLVAQAHQMSEIKTLLAYLRTYDGALWGTRSLAQSNQALDLASNNLALLLASDPRYPAALQLAARMRPSILKLDQLLKQLKLKPDHSFCLPIDVDILHAMRIALMEHLFLLAARIPNFAPMSDFSRRDVITLIFDLKIPEAVEILRLAFPTKTARLSDFPMDEPAEWPPKGPPQYGWVDRELIAPLAQTHGLITRITATIAHYYRALG